MSLLVEYTLKSADDFEHQTKAMESLVAGLNAAGITGLNYSCFSTDNRTKFIGVLEFADDVAKQGFLESEAFAAYKATVGPTFANPPQTTEIAGIASTRN